MVEDKGLTAYLSFPITPMTKGILLEEYEDIYYSIHYSGMSSDVRNNLPKVLIEDMRENGALIIARKVRKLRGKKELFGVNATSLYDGKDIIRVRVLGENIIDMSEKIKIVTDTMGKFGYVPKQCVWNRLGRYS
ncbi:MAG: hypothetical protein PHQ67_04010 [Fermentimonas sp.]|nr:hypothetical protein [Fermentimonas sp.]